MGAIEITIILCIIFFVVLIISLYLYKKIHHIPTSTCDCKYHKITSSKLVEEYHKKYKKM